MSKQYITGFPQNQTQMAEWQSKYKFDTGAGQWYQETATPVAPTSTAPITQTAPTVSTVQEPPTAPSAYTGSSIVDYLKFEGGASDFASRSRLAADYGISSYAGTASQNTQLLNMLKRGTRPTPVPSAQSNITATNASGLNLPTGSQQAVGTGGVEGLIAFERQRYEDETRRADAAAQREQQAIQQQQAQTKPFLDRMLGSKTPEQARTQATAETGVDVSQYFSESNAAAAELDALNITYNNKVAEKDNASLQAGQEMAPMTFIRGNQALIQNQYNIELNRMAANINSKAASLQAKQGRFNEAQNYINNAVAAATAETKFNMDMHNFFWDRNQDIIERQSTERQNALADARESATNAYTLAINQAQQVGEYMMNNPQAGITINDSISTAQQKIVQSGGTAQFQLQQRQEDRLNAPGIPDVPETRVWSDFEIKTAINALQANNATFNDVVQEIQFDVSIENKDRAIQLAKEAYGVSDPQAEEVKKATIITSPGAFSAGQELRTGLKGLGKWIADPFVSTIGQTALKVSDFFTGLFRQ